MGCLVVGVIEGANEGVIVGAVDGGEDTVGWYDTEGSYDGLHVGVSVGRVDGTKVGWQEGLAVVGTMDGLADGE